VELIMTRQGYSRRDFIKGASALMAPSLFSRPLLAQTGAVQRLEWNTFRTTRHYASLVNAIATMKENTNPGDKRSWTYWVNAHVNF
jgi:tyrosinase